MFLPIHSSGVQPVWVEGIYFFHLQKHGKIYIQKKYIYIQKMYIQKHAKDICTKLVFTVEQDKLKKIKKDKNID